MKNKKMIAPALFLSAILLTGCNKSDDEATGEKADAVETVEETTNAQEETATNSETSEANESSTGAANSSNSSGSSTSSSQTVNGEQGKAQGSPTTGTGTSSTSNPTGAGAANGDKNTGSTENTAQQNQQAKNDTKKGSIVTMNLKDIKDFIIRDSGFGQHVVTFKKENLPADLKDKGEYTIKVNAIEYTFKESTNVPGNFHAAVDMEHATEKEVQNGTVSGQ